MIITNYIKLEFPSCSANESFARAAAAGFAAQLDPTLEELGDIKTAVYCLGNSLHGLSCAVVVKLAAKEYCELAVCVSCRYFHLFHSKQKTGVVHDYTTPVY